MTRENSKGGTSSTLSVVAMMEGKGLEEESGESQDLVLPLAMEEEEASEEDPCMEENSGGTDTHLREEGGGGTRCLLHPRG